MINGAELDRLAAAVEKNTRLLTDVHKALYGNGKPRDSVLWRLEALEGRSRTIASIINEWAKPVVTGLVLGLIWWLISGAP